MNQLLLMKKLIIAFSAIAVSGISLISNNALAETLYHVPGGGRWGGEMLIGIPLVITISISPPHLPPPGT